MRLENSKPPMRSLPLNGSPLNERLAMTLCPRESRPTHLSSSCATGAHTLYFTPADLPRKSKFLGKSFHSQVFCWFRASLKCFFSERSPALLPENPQNISGAWLTNISNCILKYKVQSSQ